MNKRIFATALLSIVLLCHANNAQGAEAGQMVIGGYYHLGFALVAGNGYELWTSQDRDDRTAKFSTGGGAYFDYYFNHFLGIEGGFGIITKGIRYHGADKHKVTLPYMELPVMAKFTIKGFQAAVGLALFVALGGRTTNIYEENKTIHSFTDQDWDYMHRVNFGPKIALGYAIPVGPISIVPGLSWTIHFVNDLDSDEIEDSTFRRDDPNYSMRATNLMFVVAVEWIIPR